MADGTAVDACWESPARWAFFHALGVLDPGPDPGLDAIADLAARATHEPVGVFIRDGSLWLLVAGSRSVAEQSPDSPPEPDAVESHSAPVVLHGLVVGELRGNDPDGEVLAHAAAAVAELLSARLERLRIDSEGRPIGVMVLDDSSSIVWVSREFEELLGHSTLSLLGSSVLDLVPPEMVEVSASLLETVRSSPGRALYFPVRLNLGTGETRLFELQPDNRLHDPEIGALTFVIRAAHDPSDEHSVLGDQIWVLNTLANGAPLEEVLEGVMGLIEQRDPDSHACLMRADRKHQSLSPLVAPHLEAGVASALRGLPIGPTSPAGGATAHFGVARFTSDLVENVSWGEIRAPLIEAGYRACWSVPVNSMAGSGSHGTLDLYRRIPGDPSEAQIRVIAVAARLAALALDQEEQTRGLRFRASHDPLTQLPNRAHFAERLLAHGDGSLGVLFVDLDRFKLVNDALGHDFGDELLRAVSARLVEHVQEPAVVARFGGDEFTVLLPDVRNLGELVDAGHALLDVISEPYEIRGQTVAIGASAGATFAEARPEDPHALVRNADAALCHAKERGRGRVEAFDDRLLNVIEERVSVERDLRQALDSGQLWAEFQPEVRIADLVVSGVEALARCCSSGGMPISPETFIPVAEEAGLISQVFEVMLTQACEVAMQWNEGRAHRIVVWVNLSPSQLGSRDLVDQIRKVIDLTGADAETLGFEVTERGILPDPIEAAHRLGDLAKLGSRLAVDDFGTGYSSLGYLRELPVDTVKLDQSFVVRAAHHTRSRAIVRAVVDLAKAMGLTCVAEGVETQAQLDVVAELGCKIVQGYVFSRPQRADDLTAWLASHEGANGRRS
ncbi:MAG: EAL domain-containing protein [Acidimicrobiales bacterium]